MKPRSELPLPPELLRALEVYYADVQRFGQALRAAGDGRADAYPQVDPTAVAARAAPIVARFVHAIAPRYAAALLRDDALVWSLRVTLELGAPTPMTPDVRRDVEDRFFLSADASPERAALWMLTRGVEGFLPPGFKPDSRFTVPRRWGVSAERSRDGINPKVFDRVGGLWPEGVSRTNVAEALHATKDPFAVDAARHVLASWWEGADGGAIAHVDASEQERIVERWGEEVAHETVGLWHVIWQHDDDDDGHDGGHDGKGMYLSNKPLKSPAEELARRAQEHPELLSHVDGEWRLATVSVARALRSGTAPPWAVREAYSMITTEMWRRWPPRAVARVLAAVERIRAEQRAARLVPIPAAKESRAAMEAVSTAPTRAMGELYPLDGRRGYRFVWKRHGEQLSLALDGTADVEVWRELNRELGPETLRDYIILHRMAAEQGRTGRFRWTWEAHRARTAHAHRVAGSVCSDDAARAAAVQRIRALGAVSLLAEERDGERVRWVVVGERPLVSVVGGERIGERIEGLTLVLNPVLYRGVHVEARTPYFTQLSDVALSLPADALAVAVALSHAWRTAHDKGGVAYVTAEQLGEWVQPAYARNRHRRRGAEAIERALRGACGALGCDLRPVEGGGWTIAPPRAWVDAVVHRVPPELPATVPLDVPTTGAELLAWREREQLSRDRAAAVLGVSPATIKRAEQEPTAPLPRSFQRATWARRGDGSGGGSSTPSGRPPKGARGGA